MIWCYISKTEVNRNIIIAVETHATCHFLQIRWSASTSVHLCHKNSICGQQQVVQKHVRCDVFVSWFRFCFARLHPVSPSAFTSQTRCFIHETEMLRLLEKMRMLTWWNWECRSQRCGLLIVLRDEKKCMFLNSLVMQSLGYILFR